MALLVGAIAAGCVCILSHVPVAALLALPVRAVVAPSPPPGSPVRFSGVQPLADLLAALPGQRDGADRFSSREAAILQDVCAMEREIR